MQEKPNSQSNVLGCLTRQFFITSPGRPPAAAMTIVALAGMGADDTNHLRVGRNGFVGGFLIGVERGVPFGESDLP